MCMCVYIRMCARTRVCACFMYSEMSPIQHSMGLENTYVRTYIIYVEVVGL